ncbi:MAG: helix-turn-helix domain-containing protein [Actinobacteria bacterium]|jgi:excisionase family DNA binding protein|nr:helix-turn-helix domain-containing protein [Actinomycetota bacterium]
MAIGSRATDQRHSAAPQWLSLQQAAGIYGVSTDTIRRRVASGDLPAFRCGRRIIRVRAEDLSRLFHEIPR